MKFYPGMIAYPKDAQCSEVTARKLTNGNLPVYGEERKVEIRGFVYWIQHNPYSPLSMTNGRYFAYYVYPANPEQMGYPFLWKDMIDVILSDLRRKGSRMNSNPSEWLKTSKVYILCPDKIKSNYGLCVFSNEEQKNTVTIAKFKYLAKKKLNDANIRWSLQGGTHNFENEWCYFELWSLPNEWQDELLTIAEEIAKELQLPLDIE